ncbi:MAG: nuclear transport factor 2 family protein, partial [bacterium]|nr:nuclear transport factor 2 family protein [bacterium]
MTTLPAGDDAGASLDADDRAAIADLLYAYAWHLDRNEPEEVGDVFTEDASLDYGPEFPTIVGRREIVVAVARGQQEIFSACSHHISNVRISPDGDGEAAVTSYVYSWTQYRSG